MIPIALECEVSVFSFWNMTLGEILVTIKAYSKRKERELKDRAYMDYKLAECIGRNIACLLSSDAEPVAFVDIYKELYEEENQAIEKKKNENKIEIQKQKMIDFANFHNSARKEVG